MKPRIQRGHGLWYCGGPDERGIHRWFAGNSPVEAYDRWNALVNDVPLSQEVIPAILELKRVIASHDKASDYGLGYQLAVIKLQALEKRKPEPNSDMRMLYGCHWDD